MSRLNSTALCAGCEEFCAATETVNVAVIVAIARPGRCRLRIGSWDWAGLKARATCHLSDERSGPAQSEKRSAALQGCPSEERLTQTTLGYSPLKTMTGSTRIARRAGR
jgi:hypothetical protein